ncbi:MAG: SDR family oxidoreductase [bacterium]
MEIGGAVVIVTGAARDAGLAIARALLARGASVLAVDADGDALAALPATLASEALATHACDLASAEACEGMVAAARERFGKLDALVHAAGLAAKRTVGAGGLLEVDDGGYEAIVGPELRGAFFANRAALKALTAQRRGEVVNVAATSGRKGRAFDSIGSAAQAGVIGMSESLAEEVRAFGVRVQCVLAPTALEIAGGDGPAGGSPSGERIADAVLFCLGLPADACCENLVVQPFSGGRSRARKAATRPSADG